MQTAGWVLVALIWIGIIVVGIACIRVAAKAEIGTEDGTED